MGTISIKRSALRQEIQEMDLSEQEEWFGQISGKLCHLDRHAMQEAEVVWRSVCKPLGSLGELESMIVRLAGILGTPDVRIDKRCVLVVCSDNGVVAEGVTQTDSSVTGKVARQIAAGCSNINVMAKAARADVFAIDVGMQQTFTGAGVAVQKIALGTQNIAEGPAMTRGQALQMVRIGVELVRKWKERGYQMIVTGEMGIGNTTTSSAVASVLLGVDAEKVTGRGAGLSTAGVKRKIDVVNRAVRRNCPNADDALDVLSKLGGFDMAAMVGMFLGGAIHHVPILMDGFISSVAALLAYRLHEECRDFMLASHLSQEPAAGLVMEQLGLSPILHAGMRLGEGTGAVCLLPILDIALAEYHNAHRFDETSIEQYQELE